MQSENLMCQRRFWPLFWTQFFGAFNDNFFKNALVILITYRGVQVGSLGPQQMVALCSGLFILPFFLFSATAGQLADRLPKDMLVRWVKGAEIGVMALAVVGFLSDNILFLVAVLFLMGLQSSVFGPVKYGILPELIGTEPLVKGNALIQTGTFLAIPLGMVAGGVLIDLESGAILVSAGVILFALFGFATSVFVPRLQSASPGLNVDLNPIRPTWQIYKFTKQYRAVYLSILGIAWFWFFGASMLALFPTWCKEVLHGDNIVATMLLVLFSLGIGTGAMLCGRLSRGHLELGIVPIGSIGMTLFTFDLFLAGTPTLTAQSPDGLLTLREFIGDFAAVRILVDLFMLSVSGGLFIVPLQTLIQERTVETHRARVISGNNILNSFFMVLSAIILMVLPKIGVSIPQTFLLLAIANVLVALYVYTVIPEFLYRFLAWMAANLIYRLKINGMENVPKEGPAVLVCNHVTFVDWLILGGGCPRPARFVMHYSFRDIPIAHRIFERCKVIPIASAKEDPEVLQEALDRIAEELEAGNVVCIFPEGRLTTDGKIGPFRPGVERIVERTPAPVVPMGLQGLWGSFFSRDKNRARWNPFRRAWSRVRLEVGAPVPPEKVDADNLRMKVAELSHQQVTPESKEENKEIPAMEKPAR